MADEGAEQYPEDNGGDGEQYEDDYGSEDEWARPIAEDACNDGGEATQARASGSGVQAVFEEDDTERELAGDTVPITFVLPGGGRIADCTFRMGHTVEALKLYLENVDVAKFPYGNVALFLNGEMMLDPLSLNDVHGVKPKENNTVEVRVS
eukprot:PhF_6_TR19238/c0_g1_i1/m.28284